MLTRRGDAFSQNDPELPFIETKRTPLDLKDKWRVLSRKLPPGTWAPADGAAQQEVEAPYCPPPLYSREHLELLPPGQLVKLVIQWQQAAGAASAAGVIGGEQAGLPGAQAAGADVGGGEGAPEQWAAAEVSALDLNLCSKGAKPAWVTR
jgi:hypothetical protein